MLVVDPAKRRATIHRAGGASEEREARGAWPLEPFDGLTIDWDEVFAEIDAPHRD